MADEARQRMLAALEEAQSLPGAGALAATMRAAFGSTPAYQSASRDLRLQDQVELDLHLKGANVVGHSTRADWLGTFMARTAVAVKEMAKDLSGKARHTPGLLVEGPSAGSVRVVFRTPTHKTKQDPVPGAEAETLDGKALHQFASLFMLAEDADDIDDSDLLSGSVRGLKGPAREALRLVAKQVIDSSWTIEGNLAARGHELQRVNITPNGAARLVIAVGTKKEETELVRVSGLVDAWKWSRSVMEFVPETGRPFTAVVPPDLQERVAAINGQPDHAAAAVFDRTTTYPSGDYSSQRHSYVLTNIEAAVQEDGMALL